MVWMCASWVSVPSVSVARSDPVIPLLAEQDGMLEVTHELEKQISREIRRWRPHVVFCQDPTNLFGGKNYINHPDHRAAGMAALNAVYPKARDPLTFPELLAEGFQPWKVWEVYVAGAKEPDTWVDVSETLETKLDALREHKSQVGDFTWVRERVMQRLADAGRDQGIPYAEVYRHMILVQEQDREAE